MDFDVAEGDGAAVFLEEDVAVRKITEALNRVKFAFGDEFVELRRVAVVFENFFAVQPVLDVITFDDDEGVVPFADVVRLFIRGGGYQIVE